METIFGLLGLILGAWAVRSICLKPQSGVSKCLKSIVAAAYFLGAGGLGGTQVDKAPVVIALLLIGAAVVAYSNHRDKTA
ncbi:hypothetical protein [Pantoea sp. B65]|uniref:hypothetical protein n=1 Tax=Pantoea sp. B65 TaxID=2813359 RepID=UPI0039B4CDEB